MYNGVKLEVWGGNTRFFQAHAHECCSYHAYQAFQCMLATLSCPTDTISADLPQFHYENAILCHLHGATVLTAPPQPVPVAYPVQGGPIP